MAGQITRITLLIWVLCIQVHTVSSISLPGLSFLTVGGIKSNLTGGSTPEAPVASGVLICIGQATTLTASGANPDEKYKWYDVPSGGIPLQISSSNSDSIYITPVLITTTTYWVSIFSVTDGESLRTEVTATFPSVSNDDQNAEGTDSWIGHTYDGMNFETYYGSYTEPETFSQEFGGNLNCFEITSNLVPRSIYTEKFSVKYRMKSTKKGIYVVDLGSDDGTKLSVDGTLIYEDWDEQSFDSHDSVLLSLNGTSSLEYDFYEDEIINKVVFQNLTLVLSNALTVNTTQAICHGNTVLEISGDVFGSLPGGITHPRYQWTYSLTPDGTRTDIPGATGETFVPSSLNSPFNNPGTYYIFRNARLRSSNNVSVNPYYAINESNAAIVTIIPIVGTPEIPTPQASAICQGTANTAFTTFATDATSYIWSVTGTGNSISGTGTTGTVSWSPGFYGTATVSVTANGCGTSSASSTTVIVNALPTTPAITAGGPLTFCEGGSVTLTSSAEAGNLWSDGSITSSISVSNSGSYTVRVTDSNGCQSAASAATVVTVNALPAAPVITADGPTTFCDGGSVTLTSSAATGNLWSDGSTNSSINVSISGSYTVRITDANGCQSSVSAATVITEISLPATPAITAGGPVTFCEGGSVTLTSSAETGYLWSNGATTSSITVAISGNYFVRITDANGCQSAASAETVVTENTLPTTPAITAGGPTSFCEGGSVTLTASAASVYLWSDGSITSGITVNNSGSYTVKITDSNGCQSSVSAATAVTEFALPATPTITAGGPTTFCEGGSVTLISGAATGYLWSDGSTTQTINIIISGSYNLQITDANGCKSAKSSTEVVTVTEMPVAIPGPDQELRFSVETQMEAELPLLLTGEWSLLSGSGRISDPNSPTAQITGLSIGKNSFLWKVLNGKCMDSARVNITVLDLFIPSVITPDGDGKNDYFEIIGMTGHVELIIFNRWGNLEYSDNNYINDWNGLNSRGMELSEDTYFFILKFEKYETKKGSVLIKR